jgi:hypothetical protein
MTAVLEDDQRMCVSKIAEPGIIRSIFGRRARLGRDYCGQIGIAGRLVHKHFSMDRGQLKSSDSSSVLYIL